MEKEAKYMIIFGCGIAIVTIAILMLIALGIVF